MKKRLCAWCMLVSVLLTLSFAGCKSEQEKQAQTVIGTCEGYDVLYEELRYITLTYRELFEGQYGEGIWDNPETAEQYRAELEETVWRILRNNYAVLATCEAYGLEKKDLESNDIKQAVDKSIESAISAYGSKKAFREELEKQYMTEHLMRFTLSVAQLENELYYVLTSDLGVIMNSTDAFVDWLEQGNYVYVQHVFIENKPGDEVEANRKKAEQVRNELLRGEHDIAYYIANGINEDTSNVTPYYLVRDVYAEDMEEAAFELTEVGDVSSVVETDSGFYVLVRMEDDSQTFLSRLPSVFTSYQWAKLEELVEEKKQAISVTLNEYGQSLDLLAIR